MKKGSLPALLIALALWALFPALASLPTLARGDGSAARGWTSVVYGAPALSMSATVGFGGHYKLGEWVPVRVELRNDGPDLNGEVQVEGVTENGLRTLYTRPVSLPARSHKSLFVYTLFTGFVRDVDVLLVQNQQVVAQTKASPDPVPDGVYLVGVVAEDPYPAAAVALLAPPGASRPVRLARLSADDLPPRVQALRSLDAIILNNFSTGNLSREQREALAAWVDMGGQLVVATGPNWQKTTEGVADLLPVEISGTRTLEHLMSLERLGGATVRNAGPFVAAAGTIRGDASLLAEEDGLPLVAVRRVGAGRVGFIALDLALEPLNGWQGGQSLWPALLAPTTSAVTPEAKARRGNPQGGPPVSASLSNIPAMDLPSARWLGLFLGAYILCVGPLNYLLLRRHDRREWAWLTVPLLTVLFSVGAYFIGFRAKGGDVIVSTISIVRTYVDGRPAVAESYFGLFSPARRSYDVVLAPEAMVSSLPDWGGWGDTRGSSGPPSLEVQQGDATILREVGVDMWSMRAFMVEQPNAVEPQLLQADLRAEGNRLVGTITNASSLPIEDAALVQGQSVSRLGTLAAGETRSVTFEFQKVAANPEFGWMSLSMRILGEEAFRGGGPPSAADRLRMRRQSLLDYVFGYGKGMGPEAATGTSGVQLVGWRSDDPLRIEVRGYTMSRSSTVLVLAELPVSFGDSRLSLPPGFLTRTVVESKATNFGTTPFGFFFGPGSAIFEFQLPPGTEGMQVEDLTLHFDLFDRGMPGQGSHEAQVFDWTSQTWLELPDLQPGHSRRLESPQRYLNQAGTIRLQLSYSGGNGPPLQVSQLDFSAQGRRMP